MTPRCDSSESFSSSSNGNRPKDQSVVDEDKFQRALLSTNLAGSKLRKQLSGTLQEHVSAPTSEFAKKQLEKMGWKEGTGLGRNRDGITTHIKVVKRQENVGLGSEKVAAANALVADEWWKSSLADTLAKLGSGNKKKKKKKGDDHDNNNNDDNKNDRKKDFTDEDLFRATGGARFGMRAGKTRNLAKWKRAENNNPDAATTTTTTTTTTENDNQQSKILELSKTKKKKKENKKKRKSTTTITTNEQEEEEEIIDAPSSKPLKNKKSKKNA